MFESGNEPIEGRYAISGCCEVRRDSKRRKKTNECGLSSLPDAVAMSCLVQVSRFDHAALSVVSKSHRSLVASPELRRLRWLMGCKEASLYVCLRVFPDPIPRWFILTPNRRLGPIPSNPYQPPDASSFVVVDSGIYVIGGIINGTRTSDVSFLDCFSHTWRRLPPMEMARASPSASLVDGKIYVFGGFQDNAEHSTWAEVFDPKTQRWEPCDMETPDNKNIHQSVVIEDGKKIYAVDEEGRSLCIVPSECTLSTSGKIDSKRGYREDWCVIGKLLFCRGIGRRIYWCEPDELVWREVKGLKELRSALTSSRHILNDFNDGRLMYVTPTKIRVRYNIIKLCTNSAGNLVIFWIAQLEDPESLELWSTEISVETREGCQVWGNVIRSSLVLKIDPLVHYGVKVFFSASVLV